MTHTGLVPKTQTTLVRNAENGPLLAKWSALWATMPAMLVLSRDALGPKTVTVRIPQVAQLLAVGLSHKNIEGCSAAVVRER